jgi:hypothetical protein
MLTDKWLRTTYLTAPEGVVGNEGGDAGGDAGGAPPLDIGVDHPVSDGPGSGRSTIRKQLEGEFEKDRKRSAAPARKGRVAQGAARLEDEPEEPKDPGTEAPVEPAAPVVAESKLAPPEGFSKEAKAEWEKTPAQVQQAILKREQDMSKGVEELKKRYTDIDQALTPRMDVIRKHGHTPGQAIHQLFSWFEALSQDPVRLKSGQAPVALEALAKSFGIDLRAIYTPQQQAEKPKEVAQEPGKDGQPAGAVPPQVQAYIDSMKEQLAQFGQAVQQRFGSIENTFQRQSQAQTQEMLDSWSKDKPYFEDVRGMMAHLITPGPASAMYPQGSPPAVPPLANGSADLDTAYDMAINAMPAVRQKVRQEELTKIEADRVAKEQKEKKAQQEAADKARKASGSLSLTAPGAPVTPQKGPKQRKSVGDSLREAIAEHSKGSRI